MAAATGSALATEAADAADAAALAHDEHVIPGEDEEDLGRQEIIDDVEQETACQSGGKAAPSFGAAAAFEMLIFLLLERLRGAVVLPMGKTQTFAYKMSTTVLSCAERNEGVRSGRPSFSKFWRMG